MGTKPLYSVEKDDETGKWVIVNNKIGYVVSERDSQREATLLADSFNHRASLPDEDDDNPPGTPPTDPPGEDGKRDRKDPPPPKDPPADPNAGGDGKPPKEEKPKARSRYWGEVE